MAGRLAETSTFANGYRFIGGIVVVTVILVGLNTMMAAAAGAQSGRAPSDPDSPEGVVYRWLAYQRGGGLEAAYALWDESAELAGSLEVYAASPAGSSFAPSEQEERLLIEPLAVEPSSARVKVLWSRYTPHFQLSAPLPKHQATIFTLTRVDDAWRISAVDHWPTAAP